MAYTLTFPVVLSVSSTGLTLTVQLVNSLGVDVGAPIAGAVVEIGGGNYLFSSSAIPDGHRGGIKFFSGVTLKAFAAIAPEDVENLNAKITTRPTAAEIDSLLSTNHGADDWDAAGGAGSDFLENPVPADYAPGTAGYILGQIVAFESLTSNAPVITESGDLEIVKGQDYRQEDANSITFTSTTWPALGNATITIEAFDETFDGDIVQQGAGTQIIRWNLDDGSTVDLPLNRYRYSVVAQLTGGNKFVLAQGRILFV